MNRKSFVASSKKKKENKKRKNSKECRTSLSRLQNKKRSVRKKRLNKKNRNLGLKRSRRLRTNLFSVNYGLFDLKLSNILNDYNFNDLDLIRITEIARQCSHSATLNLDTFAQYPRIKWVSKCCRLKKGLFPLYRLQYRTLITE